MYKIIYDKYEIHDNGDLFSLKPSGKKKRKYSISRDGYCIYALSYNGKPILFSAHRLVAINFIDNPENKPTVNHIDGNKLNNDVSNLEWATYSENGLHAYRTGLKVGNKGEKNWLFGKKGRDNPNYGKKRDAEYLNRVSKKVIDHSSGRVFNSTLEAANFLGIKRGTLKSYLCGHDKNPTSLTYLDYQVPINQKIKETKKIVLNIENGIFYDSISDAAKSVNMKYTTLAGILQGRSPSKTKFILA